MATTLNAVTFMGKSYSTMQNVVQNEENLTLKQMFDITAQTIHNDDEIYCLDKIMYQRNTWTQLSLINDPVIISLQSTKVYVFSDSVLCLGKVMAPGLPVPVRDPHFFLVLGFWLVHATTLLMFQK